MRWLASILCVGWLATAGASPLTPKPSTDAYPLDALRDFLAGVRADREADPSGAMGAYRESLRHSKQPNSYFNLAELEVRYDLVGPAIEDLETYLKLVPKAADRAEVEKVIRDLRTRPPEYTIGGFAHGDDGHDTDAIVLLDGAIVGPSPAVVHPSLGDHVVERITASSYERKPVRAVPGGRGYFDLSNAVSNDTGNVLISGLIHADRWTEGTTKFVAGRRFSLPKGHYSFGPGVGLCAPVEFDVASTTDTTYVHVDGPESLERDCFPVKRVVVRTFKVGSP